MVRNEGLALVRANQLFYNNDLSQSKAVPKKDQGTVEVHIPSNSFWWHSADNQLEYDAAAIHELTHAAEIMAKIRGGNVDDLSNLDLMTNPRDTDETEIAVRNLMKLLDAEEGFYKSIPFSSYSSGEKTLYSYLDERLNYAYQPLMHETHPSNFEAVTVVNQIMHVMDMLVLKKPAIERSKFYLQVNREATLFDTAREGG